MPSKTKAALNAIQEMRSVMPAPQRWFDPADKAYKPFLSQFEPQSGGRYLEMKRGEAPVDITGQKVSNATISIGPDGKPQMLVSPELVDETGTSGRGTAKTKTNLFKRSAGWDWVDAPEGYENIPTLVSVENRGNHYYGLSSEFPKGVELTRYENAAHEPRLRPTTQGNVHLGDEVGRISVRGKEHPVYDKLTVKELGLPISAAGLLQGSGVEPDSEGFAMGGPSFRGIVEPRYEEGGPVTGYNARGAGALGLMKNNDEASQRTRDTMSAVGSAMHDLAGEGVQHMLTHPEDILSLLAQGMGGVGPQAFWMTMDPSSLNENEDADLRKARSMQYHSQTRMQVPRELSTDADLNNMKVAARNQDKQEVQDAIGHKMRFKKGGEVSDQYLPDLEQILQDISSQKLPNVLPFAYTDQGDKYFGGDNSTYYGGVQQSGKYRGYNAGVNVPLSASDSLNLSGNYGRVMGSSGEEAPANWGIRGMFTRKFAEGGLVPQEYDPNFAYGGTTMMDQSLEDVAQRNQGMAKGGMVQRFEEGGPPLPVVDDSVDDGGGGGGSDEPQAKPAQAPSLADKFAAIEKQYGLPQGYLARVRNIESGGGRNTFNKLSGAAGDFQFIPSTAKQYGLSNPYDTEAAADAAARLAADNRAALIKAGIQDPTADQLYLAHQQGSGGATKLLTNPNARATDLLGANAVNWNGGNADMTAGDMAKRVMAMYSGAPSHVKMASADGSQGGAGSEAMSEDDFKKLVQEANDWKQKQQEKQTAELQAMMSLKSNGDPLEALKTQLAMSQRNKVGKVSDSRDEMEKLKELMRDRG